MNIFGDTTIKVGDMVMVVRDCCGRYVGIPFKVSRIQFIRDPGIALCDHCKREYSNIDVTSVAEPHRLYHAPLFWLKKIDPPQIEETEERREEITA